MRAEQKNGLEGAVSEEFKSFVSKRDQHVKGIIIHLEYCDSLVERGGTVSEIRPTIKCHTVDKNGMVYGSYEEHLGAYRPIDTNLSPTKIAEIGGRLESKAETMKKYSHLQGLIVMLCKQNPPSVHVYNNTPRS